MSVTFPNLKPTSRTYKPGTYPQTFFKALNGATSVVQFGAQNFNAELTLLFSNINDRDANSIINAYETSNGLWERVNFNSGVMDCAGSTMQARMKEGSPLRWRFAEPPTVTYKFRNICDVSCRFTAYIDGV